MVKNNIKPAVIFASLLYATGLTAQKNKDGFIPRLFQVTTAETRPGDAVLVRGEYIDQIKEIFVGRLPDEPVDDKAPAYVPLPAADALMDANGTERRTDPQLPGRPAIVHRLLQNRQSLKFILPRDEQSGVYSVRLKDIKGRDMGFYLNIPRVNWVISEGGLQAVAGDYLRIQGKNLRGVAGREQVALVSANGKHVVHTRVDRVLDDYSVSINIPADVPAGHYTLYYHNGWGGPTAWSEPLKIKVTTKLVTNTMQKTFNVQDYGAKGDGLNNETAAFRTALHAADSAGGGTVYVPRGRYVLTGELIIPPYTTLQGESKALTQLVWSSLNWDIGELPNSLISGTHHFGVKDLNIWATRAWGIIMSTGEPKEQGNITLENLVVRQTPMMGGIMYDVKANRDKVEAELKTRWNKSGIVLRGPNLKVRNCAFNSNGFYIFSAASGFIQHCRFERVTTGINQPYMAIHPKGLIFEDCYKQADGYGYAATIDESHDLYEARNVVPYDYTNDREVMTLDGGGGAYAGKIGGIDGRVLMLPKDASTYQWTPDKWVGGGVFIIEGKGAGQYRRIVHHTLDSIILDQPFLVDPDASSTISITTIRKNLFFIDNEASDGGAYQLYGSAQNVVIAGLKLLRCNGVVSRGSFLYHGKQPNWYVEIVGCTLREGNYSHWFGVDDRHSGYQNINLIGTGGGGLNIGTLVRRNTLYDFSYIRTSPGADHDAVTDAIIEDNSITTAKKAILLGGAADNTSHVLIHNNHYKDVEKQVELAPGLRPESNLILDDGVTPVQTP
ncbi:MAG TPA: glycosyl hydrolase family 28-related protein [Puia sp.]|nr:glycosyl hydrolase family 28-related protein [Puia sp.]